MIARVGPELGIANTRAPSLFEIDYMVEVTRHGGLAGQIANPSKAFALVPGGWSMLLSYPAQSLGAIRPPREPVLALLVVAVVGGAVML